MTEQEKGKIAEKAFNAITRKKFRVIGRHVFPFEKEYMADSAEYAIELAKKDKTFWDDDNQACYQKEQDYYQIDAAKPVEDNR